MNTFPIRFRVRLLVAGLLASFLLMSAGAAWAVTYYSQGNLPPEALASWNSIRTGGGSVPLNFSSGDVFVIQNPNSMGTLAVWTVSGAGATIQIESRGTLTANNIVAVPTFQVDNGGTYIHNATSGASNGTAADIPGSLSRTLAAGSTVEFQKWANGGTGPVALPNLTWGNLRINVALLGGSWQQSGALQNVAGNLFILATGGTTREFRLNANSPTTSTLNLTGNLLISGGIFNITSGTAVETFNIGDSFQQTGGTFTATGAGPHSINFTGGNPNVTFSKSAAGTINGSSINWTIAAGKTVTIISYAPATNLVFTGRTFTINGTLALNGGNFYNGGILALGSSIISTGANKVSVSAFGSLTRTTGYVNGNLEKAINNGPDAPTFEIGDDTNYTPVGLQFGNVTVAGFVTASTAASPGAPPAASLLSGSKYVDRSWTLENNGVVFNNYSATFNFVSGDLAGGADPNNLIVAKNTTGTWTNPTVGTRTATSTQATGLTQFSEFRLGELATYTIDASAGAGGTITPSGLVVVNSGDNQSFTIAANSCFTIADVLVDGVSQGAISSYTFSNVTADHTIAASFAAAGPFTIAASAGAGGSISPSGDVSVACGTDQAFTIAANACFTIANVVVDGASQGPITTYTFANVTANHTIAASFSAITYTIDASAGAGGSISPSGNVVVACGGSQVFSVSANTCFAIADVVVDGASQGPIATYTFTNVTANHTIAASFSAITYTIDASAGAGGSISPSGNVVVACGGSQAFSVSANTCFAIADVVVDGASQGAISSYTFSNVQTNHTISATFTAQGPYTIVASAGAGGTISPSGNVSVACGATQVFSIAANTCFAIADVVVDGASQGAISSYTFSNVQTNHTISATFTGLGPYTIAASAGPGGTISPSGNVSVACGASQVFSIAANTCFAIADVVVDGASQGAIASYTFSNVQTNHTISATFTGLGPYTIAASAGPGGTISPSGNVSVACGGTQVFSVAANTCFAIADVVVDGASQGAIASYTFSNVQTNHTISATFTGLGPYTIAASAGPGGTISPSGNVVVACGGSQVFSIAANTCFAIANVVVDGASQGAIASYTFSNVQTNHTISATFTGLGPYTIAASAGPGGTISPSGNVSVACGASQTFSIAANSCFTIANVVVDGASQGAISSYTFTNVQTNHTISATFTGLGPYTIAASAGAGGTISPRGNVSVACGANQVFSIAANSCFAIASVVVDGVSQGAISSYTFTNVQTNHTISATFTGLGPYTIAASAGAGGTISPSGNVSVACGANRAFAITANACFHITSVVVDGASQGAISSYTFTNVQANHTISASFAFTVVAIPAVSGLTAEQVKLGNDADGTTKIKLTFTAPGGGTTIEVYRKGFGNYPLYDNNPGAGSVPTSPASYPPAGWTLTGVTASGLTDEPPTRDFWYFVAYAKDACGNISPVSTMTTGTLDYHLGDVSNGLTLGQGDNQVSTADASLLGAFYGLTGGALNGFEYLDFGPTTDGTTNGRPTTDSKTSFEDLVILALNYAPRVSLVTKGGASTQAVDVLSVRAPEAVRSGDEFDALVQLSGAGDLLGLSIGLGWNSSVANPVGVRMGELIDSQHGVVFSPGPGQADAALLGRGQGMTGEGTVAIVHFRAVADGEPRVSIATVIGRDNSNHDVLVTTQNPLAVESVVTTTDLMPVIPNPAPGKATLKYSLALRGAVDLSIYSVDGRLVKTLAHGIQEVGRYQVAWDGTDQHGSLMRSGMYFVRFKGPALLKTRAITLMR